MADQTIDYGALAEQARRGTTSAGSPPAGIDYSSLASQARGEEEEPIGYRNGMPVYSIDVYGRAGPPPQPPAFQGMDAEGKPIIASPPGPAAPPMAFGLQTPQQQRGNTPTRLNPRTGLPMTPMPMGTIPVIDAPYTGGAQAIAGLETIAGAKSPRDVAGGTSEMIRGGLEAALPLIPGAFASAPLATAITLALGTGLSNISEHTLNAMGVPREYSALASDLVGLFGAGAAHSKLQGLAKLPYLREANAIRTRLEEAVSRAKDPNAAPADRATALAEVDALTRGLQQAEAGAAGNTILPEVSIRREPGTPWVKNQLNPIEQASEDYLRGRGIDTSLSMQTGDPRAAHLEGAVRQSPGGGYANEARNLTREKVQELGPREFSTIGAGVTPEEAGGAVRSKLASDLEQSRKTLGRFTSPIEATTPEAAGTKVSTKLASELEQTRSTVANQVSPAASTPEISGAKVLEAGKAKIRQFDQAADESYKAASKAEQDPRNLEEIARFDRDGKVMVDDEGNIVTERMPLPIDMGHVRNALKPLADKYEYTLRETDARASLGLKAMRNIINGPRFKPASAAELDLGMLKEAARTENLPELRDQSQGLAAASVKELQQAINEKMEQAHYPGWDGEGTSPALRHLQSGRLNTAKKHEVANIFKPFGRNIEDVEPVSAFKRMTWAGDAGIEHLREVATIAPEHMPEVGRAFIDGGGNWKTLGPETKKILFRNPRLISDLDAYYAKKEQFGPLTEKEPVALFKDLTSGRDANINQLREVAKIAPEHMPEVGKAFIDSGGKWDALGPETKKVLFQDSQLIKNLDEYYAKHEKFGGLTEMEPVALFDKLTAPRAKSNELLADIKEHAPEQMPGLLRAFVGELWNRATREGDFKKVQSTLDKYLEMDPKSKSLMIDDPQIMRNLDNLFFSMKRLSQEVNPSGSGYIIALNAMKGKILSGLGLIGGGAAGVGGHGTGGAALGAGVGLLAGAGAEVLANKGIARLLFDPRFTKLLTQGIKFQLKGNDAGAKLIGETLSRMASEERPPGASEGGPPKGAGTPPAGGAPPAAGGGAAPSAAGAIGTKLGQAVRETGKRVMEEEEGSLTLRNLRKADRAAGSEQSTRVPSAVKATEDPLSNILTTGYKSWIRDPEMLRKNVSAVLDYPNFRDLQAQVKSGALSIPDAAEHIIKRIQENLQWLHDAMPANFRDRARLWYDGAHTIARKWSADYGSTPEQVAASMAVTSPGTDWFVNAERARRLLEFWQDRGSKAWDPRMETTWNDKISKAIPEQARSKVYKLIKGKSFKQVANDPDAAPIWFRLYDEAVNPREYHTLTPEGKAGDLARIGSGDPRQFSWSDFGQIKKVLSILEDGSRENIHQNLGQEHKVRNFYNNIINPDSPREHTTIDTHAVAAGLVRPLSQMSTEVGHNFGGTGSSSSSVSGESGTYGLHKEAYRRAAAANGLLPREMQSITWEAIRSMFSPQFKRNPANIAYINSLWQDVSSGKITADAARQRALQYAGGFDRPEWFKGRWNPAVPKAAKPSSKSR